MLCFPTFRNRREEIDGQGICIGAAVVERTSKAVTLHSVTTEYIDELKKLFGLLKKVGAIPVGFHFSTIQVLVNANVKPRIDKNANDSITFTCGTHEGGELVVEDEFINVFRSPFRFSGDRMHFVAPFYRHSHLGGFVSSPEIS